MNESKYSVINKPRYIEAQEAEERIVALWRKEKGAYADTFNTAIDACQTIILDMFDNSSQDVVPVVRCKDCKWYKRKYPWNAASTECSYHGAPMDDNDYCSWGERREDVQESD